MIELLNKEELQAITDMASIAQSLKIHLILIGANARRLSFDIPFGFASPRTTQDWDFAAPMENWETFTRFLAHAIDVENGQFRSGDSAHRIIHCGTGILIDLIPFGPISEAQGKIQWPQSQRIMSVLGFEEAHEFCIHEMLPNGSPIGIVTPALLAALKIIAYSDRGETVPRDLPDLWFIMEHYARPPEHERRVFDELAELFPDESYFEHLGSLLLGWDIGHKCRPATLAAMQHVLKELASEDSTRIESLLTRIGDQDEQEAKRQRIRAEFEWLQKGVDLAMNAKASAGRA